MYARTNSRRSVLGAIMPEQNEPHDEAIEEEIVEEGTPEQADVPIEGDSPDEIIDSKRFVVSSYGWDSDVEGLVKRLERGDIYTPGFQRNLVWDRGEKSRFVESLILGLPVPTVFLAQDSDSKRLNIVDGQQRLRTLQQYLLGQFALSGRGIPDDLKGRYFSKEAAKSKSSKVLSDSDARALSDALVHSVVIKPDPTDDDEAKGHEYNRAVIQIFYRLNTSGRPLQAQEIRASIFHGELDETLRKMNANESWRLLFGPVHGRLKDIEAILRYLALLTDGDNYKSPMPRFLDTFMEKNRHIDATDSTKMIDGFCAAADLVVAARGVEAFKQGGTFLLSRFDAMMVGITRGLYAGKAGPEWVSERWEQLEEDPEYQWTVAEFVNDTNRVTKRLERSVTIFTA
jgi:hypothetical protein